MDKTLRQFAQEILNIKDELLDKKVVIEAPNRLEMTPTVKFIADVPLELTKENVKKAVITWR